MKNLIFQTVFVIAFVMLMCSFSYAQDTTKSGNKKGYQNRAQRGAVHRAHNFVDKNGDGYNDNAPDDDGDGIPNGLDPDYQPKLKLKNNGSHTFIDLNGDGINDSLQFKGKNPGSRKRMHSPKNVSPQDGTNSQNGRNGQNKSGKKRGKN